MTVPVDSPLGRSRLRKVTRAQDRDPLEVELPTTEPPVVIRLGYISVQDFERIDKAVGKRPADAQSVERNAAVIAKACRGIGVRVDGETFSIDGAQGDDVDPDSWPRFSPDLVDLVPWLSNLPRGLNSAALVRAFYADDDWWVGRHVRAYTEWLDEGDGASDPGE